MNSDDTVERVATAIGKINGRPAWENEKAARAAIKAVDPGLLDGTARVVCFRKMRTRRIPCPACHQALNGCAACDELGYVVITEDVPTARPTGQEADECQ